MESARLLMGMELARARARAAGDPGGRAAALARAGDAYERVRRPTRGPGGEAARPGAGEALWRGLGRALAALLAAAPRWRRLLEDRLLLEVPPAPPGPEA
jgi:hypothetical protein